MKYPANRIKIGQTIRARSRECGEVTMTVRWIRWSESTVTVYDAAGKAETLNPFDWVELEEDDD